MPQDSQIVRYLYDNSADNKDPFMMYTRCSVIASQFNDIRLDLSRMPFFYEYSSVIRDRSFNCL